MCGIAGIVRSDHTTVSGMQLNLMTRVLKHRGPEFTGSFLSEDGHVALGHQRLCVLDTSEAANQPFVYLSRYHVVHNGEIYNYLELRQNLIRKGYAFRTESDTEVIAAAYAAYGEACVKSFNGAFAFVIWDNESKKLFAARDRFGEKPFYYFFDGTQLLFASEMKALWSAGIEKKVNGAMLYNFLTIGYTSNPYDPAETFFEGVNKLPSASTLLFVPGSDHLRIEKYWETDKEVDEKIDEARAMEKFLSLLTSSVELRLRSDVASGTSLSGGLDSATIVALCEKLSPPQYSHRSFTAVFPGFRMDESQQADLVAQKYRLQHVQVSMEAVDIPELMDKVMELQEEPIGSASPLAQYKVFQSAKAAGVTVLLDGQGADEILGGYHKYYAWYWQEKYRKGELSKELEAARSIGIHIPFGWPQKIAATVPHFAASLYQSKKIRDAARNKALDRNFSHLHKKKSFFALPAHFDLNSALYFNSFVSGLEDLLRIADRNSMGHAVEVRLPFLDHRLVEFLFSLPSHFKMNQGWTKWLLRKAMEPILPSEITWRKDKVGFEPPQKAWMERQDVQEAIRESKKDLVQRGILDRSVLTKKIQPHDSYAAENNDWKYWSAFYLFR